jgi:mono/diheme cytochrome c family protein
MGVELTGARRNRMPEAGRLDERRRLVWLTWLFAGGILLLGAGALRVVTQTIRYAKPPDAKAGKVIYQSGCIACHGATGSGAAMSSTMFTRPDSWPDFSRCDQTTPEQDINYKAVIVHGGPYLGFSQIMPAFNELLTDEQINDVIAYIRTLGHNTHHYPMGALNLPRSIVTEKAFPEDEEVVTTAANATGLPSYTTDVIHEETFAGRNQLEVDVPVNYADQTNPLTGKKNWTAGAGDITVGLKREMFSSLRTGSILSLQGGVLLPSGDSKRGFGAGTTQFEPFAAFDQLFKTNTFFQLQAGADLPVDTSVAPRSMFWRAAVGQSLAPDHGLGRLFSPQLEFLADRNFEPGAVTDWDILPEMQVTVSRRQHVRAAVGVRTPFTDTAGRAPQVEFYVLWDWADGKLWEGWR